MCSKPQGDSADDPRYIKTVSDKGYRFIAAPPRSAPKMEQSGPEVERTPPEVEAGPLLTPEAVTPSSRKRGIASRTAVFAAVATVGLALIDHPGIVYADPIGALAYLEAGKACALSGDRARAKSAYQEFLSLWRDADPDISVYRQAKAEYSRL